MKKDTVVIDLDGTLANIDHRLHYIKREKPDWDGFFKACVDDKLNDWCAELITAMRNTFKTVLIVSARSKLVEVETKEWLDKIFGPFFSDYALVMLRENGDTTPDDDLKIKWLHSYGKERILFVVDDRQCVVDMWRSEGLVCLQCYAWPEWKPKKEAPKNPGGEGKG